MALAVPVLQAAAIMLPLLLIMAAFGIKALWHERDRALLRLLVPAGLLGTLIGVLLFSTLSAKTVAALVGCITLWFLAIRTVFPPRADVPPPPRPLGFFFATVSGFTSFVAHAGGPPIGFYMLPLRLAPVGVWVGVRLVRHIPPTLFYRLFSAGMLLTGCKLLWDGLN